MRFVIVRDSLSIEELADIIRIITTFLQPDGEVILVEALADEFWITA